MQKTVSTWLIVLWLGFVVFAYFGDYPFFIVDFFKSIFRFPLLENSLNQIDRVIDFMHFNQISPEWISGKFTFLIRFYFNYVFARELLSSRIAKIFLLIGIGLLVTSAVASLFELIQYRATIYRLISLLYHPGFMLLIFPIRVFLYYQNTETQTN